MKMYVGNMPFSLSESELRELFAPGATDLVLHESEYYWAIRYRIAPPGNA